MVLSSLVTPLILSVSRLYTLTHMFLVNVKIFQDIIPKSYLLTYPLYCISICFLMYEFIAVE